MHWKMSRIVNFLMKNLSLIYDKWIFFYRKIAKLGTINSNNFAENITKIVEKMLWKQAFTVITVRLLNIVKNTKPL